MTKEKTLQVILIGIFAGVMAVCSWLTIPLPGTLVPINLALLGVYLCGGLLGPIRGFYCELVYILLGAIGLPVFAGFSGGFGDIIGPTGGFIVGYLLGVIPVGLLCRLAQPMGKERSAKVTYIGLALACVPGMLVCYALGLLWFVHVTGSSWLVGIMSCVVPFLPGDAVKIMAASLLLKRLRPLVLKK